MLPEENRQMIVHNTPLVPTKKQREYMTYRNHHFPRFEYELSRRRDDLKLLTSNCIVKLYSLLPMSAVEFNDPRRKARKIR